MVELIESRAYCLMLAEKAEEDRRFWSFSVLYANCESVCECASIRRLLPAAADAIVYVLIFLFTLAKRSKFNYSRS